MIPEAMDLVCIPVLINEVPFRPLTDDETVRIAEKVLRILPSFPDMRLAIIPALYYVSDLFSRSLLDEIPINSVALAGLLERRGRTSRVYMFNPYRTNGLLPAPSSVSDGSGGLTWAVIPVVAFGEGYVDLDEYYLEMGGIDEGLEELEEVLREIYLLSYVKVFPPVLAEELLEEISALEEELDRDLRRRAPTAG